jgi:hypothetical protein
MQPFPRMLAQIVVGGLATVVLLWLTKAALEASSFGLLDGVVYAVIAWMVIWAMRWSVS